MSEPQDQGIRLERLVDLIVGDLVRETNIFPNQVQRAKELIRERLKAAQQKDHRPWTYVKK